MGSRTAKTAQDIHQHELHNVALDRGISDCNKTVIVPKVALIEKFKELQSNYNSYYPEKILLRFITSLNIYESNIVLHLIYILAYISFRKFTIIVFVSKL